MTLNQLINTNLHYLLSAGIETSKFEMRLLAAFVLKIELSALSFYNQDLTQKQADEFSRLVELRKRHCPVDKIIGSKGFYKYDFVVNNDVLSPRADTEILVESAVKIIKEKNLTDILEFGVGSGCIILSILADCPQVCGTGIDISEKALATAAINAKNLDVCARLNLVQSSWFDDTMLSRFSGKFDMIISNPPYIPSHDIAALDDEVKNFDPITALDGGPDGLRDYRQIANLASGLLKPNGYLIFEAGINQADDIVRIAYKCGLGKEAVLKDLCGIDRCIILKKQFTLPKVRIL